MRERGRVGYRSEKEAEADTGTETDIQGRAQAGITTVWSEIIDTNKINKPISKHYF